MTAQPVEYDPPGVVALRPLRRLPVPVTEPRPALRVVRDDETFALPGQAALRLESGRTTEDFAARQPTGSTDLPDPQAWAAQFVQVAIEVALGFRPPGQLVRWTGADVFVGLQRRHRLAGRVRSLPHQITVRGVRACAMADGVVEASATVRLGPRCRAVALRLEGLDGRWRVTALEM